MLKYVILIIVVGMAVTMYVAQRQATKPPVEQTISESLSPHAGEVGGQAIAGEVIETMNAGGYTYVHVNTGKEKVWAAGPQTEVKVGDKVSFVAGMEMPDFKSESLDRTFKRIQFVSAINIGESTSPTLEGHPPITKTAPDLGDTDFSDVHVPGGGKSIADVYAQRDALAGKEVTVRGKVVKFTAGVMGKNWIHLMDGTGGDGTDDLTVTTDAVARVGDVVTVQGQIGTDKDFGFGYKYDVIVENAVITVDT